MSATVSARIWYDDDGCWRCYRLRVEGDNGKVWTDDSEESIDRMFRRCKELTGDRSPRYAGDDGWTLADPDGPTDWRWSDDDDEG